MNASADTDATPKLVTLREATKLVEQISGYRPHRAAIYRWRTAGVSGVKLRCLWAVGGYHTTEAWIRDFFEQVTRAKNGEAVAPTATNTDAALRAERELSKAGI